MSNIVNTFRQVTSTAPYEESTNSQQVKNIVDVQMNGVSPSSLSYGVSSLTSSDNEVLNQAMKIIGYFVSLTERPIYTIPVYGDEINPIKGIESQVGIPYDFLLAQAANEKFQRVFQDNVVKNRYIDLLNVSDLDVSYNVIRSQIDMPDYSKYGKAWGEESFAQKINKTFNLYSSNQIDKDGKKYPIYNKKIRLAKIENIYNKGFFTNLGWQNPTFRKTAQLAKVILKEDRMDAYEAITSRGEYSTDCVEVEIYQMPDNFGFGTQQQFSDASPRGSQTPLRFYDKNQPRILDMTLKLHQQEYPLEPLLSIAEKLQYLARPYRHSDFSLIPKLVRVSIPGRVFRGYISSISINYSGDDYTGWESPERVYEGLHKKNGNTDIYASTGELNYPNIEAQAKAWERGELKGFSNDKETMYYGLSSISATINLAIVEEIKLSLYTTFIEKQEEERKAQEEEEKRKREEAIEYARNNVKNLELSTFPDELKDELVDKLIYVDENGYPVDYIPFTPINASFDEKILAETKKWALERQGYKSLEDYNNDKEVEQKNQSKSSDVSYANESFARDLDVNSNIASRDDLIDVIMSLQQQVGIDKPDHQTYEENTNKEFLRTQTSDNLNERRKALLLLLVDENNENGESQVRFFYEESTDTFRNSMCKGGDHYLLGQLLAFSITDADSIINYCKQLKLQVTFCKQVTGADHKMVFSTYFPIDGATFIDLPLTTFNRANYVAISRNVKNSYKINISHSGYEIKILDMPFEEKYKTYLRKVMPRFGSADNTQYFLDNPSKNPEAFKDLLVYHNEVGQPYPDDKTLFNYFVKLYQDILNDNKTVFNSMINTVCGNNLFPREQDCSEHKNIEPRYYIEPCK